VAIPLRRQQRELNQRISAASYRITAAVVNLAGCQLHVKTVSVSERLPNGCIDHCPECGANCVTADRPTDEAAQIFIRSFGAVRSVSTGLGASSIAFASWILELSIRFTGVDPLK
jgi:hypothetical protein